MSHAQNNEGDGEITQNNDDNSIQQMAPHYRASYSSGIYGSYVINDVNAMMETSQNGEVDEKTTIMDQLDVELRSILKGVETSRDDIYRLAKQVYRQRGCPVIIDIKDSLTDIRKNSANYKNVALPLILAMDKEFATWNEQAFKQEFSNRFNIPIKCVQISSVKAGSVIIDLQLKTHSNGNKLMIPIECIADNITTDKAKKALVEFGIFAMEFGEPVAGFDCLQMRVLMNPRWNRQYGPGHTNWKGSLGDGKSRGGEPYFCPVAWKKFAVQFNENAYDFKNVYDQWPIAYHGTKFNFSMMITLSGLKAFDGCHGTGVYLSPSIKYVAHPRYCKPYKLDLDTASQAKWSAEHIREFKKYDGKWIQCAFACRVKPGSYLKKCQTMNLGNNGKFDGIDKRTIEWVVPGKKGEVIGSDKILIYGFMIKASARQPPSRYEPENDVDDADWCILM